jgi:hypothetical protein
MGPHLLVVALVGGTPGGPGAVVGLLADGELFCSATVIAPRVVMTAAHCLALVDPAAEITVFFGPDTAEPGETILVVDRLRHPDWSFDAQPNDIGLLALDADAPETPIPPSTRALTEDDLGTEVELVGYGKTDELAEDYGLRRTGMTPIANFEPYRITIGPGPPTICHGDSGGAVLLDGAVIGIHSRSDCDFLNLAERVDAHMTFIDDFVADHPPDAGGCSSAPGPCLSPVACCLFAGLLVTRRRGSSRPARRAPPAPPAA